MSDLADLYQDVILDHSRHPRNFGAPEQANREAKGNNPLCGDRVTIYLQIDGDVIESAGFDARGCAISLASASMMTEMVKGKTVAEARAIFDRFHRLVTSGEGGGEGLDEIEALSGVREFPTRIKCATLPWHAMSAAIDGSNDEVKTE
ncbi:MAG: Fe-S cluster assembly sulfur transfer protein SufU [Alphaproteobacteria bacterium]